MSSTPGSKGSGAAPMDPTTPPPLKQPLLRRIDATSAAGRVELAALIATLHGGGLTSLASSSRPERSDVSSDAAKPTDDIESKVGRILEQVRRDGDAAVLALTAQFDAVTWQAEQLRVPQARLREAHAAAPADFMALMRAAVANIRDYQQHILHRQPPPLQRGGRRLGLRYTPIERVGVYVPGGQALYPSSVLMTVVPALVAGVRDIVLVSPPRGGDIHPLLLALACELGVTEVYRVGGAVAVAALAFGTASIPAVHKIVGPGNAYVAEAKRQVLGTVGIDSIAGPSEVAIIADDSARADWVAADMLAQAEHDPGSSVLLTPSTSLADAVVVELERQLPALERHAAISSSLQRYAAIVVTADLPAACDLANELASEHLQLMTRDDGGCLQRLRHAGAIFIGPQTPVALGDYFAGPSHVLPTGGTARFFGPLSCNDFLKASSVIEYDEAALAEDAASVIDFASREGLTAHAASVALRRPPPQT